MKRKLLAFIMVLGLTLAAQVTRADVNVDFFYDNLSGGNWIEVGDYGYCWQPDVAVDSSDWRPYADGYWAYTDEGWTWVSYEDFGWATYHYGRWAHLSDAGWVWVPCRDRDLEWGPAWVSWRTGGDYIGWAPLPPTGETIYEGRAITGHVDIDFDIGPAYYNFVDVRYIGEPVLRERIIAPAQNITYINQTVNVTNITYKNKVVYNYGPDINVINQRATRPIQRLTIQRDNSADFSAVARSGGLKTKVQGQSLVIAAPMRIGRSNRAMAPAAVKSKVAKANLDTGWAGVGDAKAREQLKQKLRSEDSSKIPQGKGAALRGGSGTGASPEGTNVNADTNARAGTSLTSATPAASVAAGTNAEVGRGGRKQMRKQEAAAAAAASANAGALASPAQAGAGGSTDTNAGLDRGRGGKHKNREQNATSNANATTDGLTGSPSPEINAQGRGQHNGRRREQMPVSPAAATVAPQTTAPTPVPSNEGVISPQRTGQRGGGNHDRRNQNATGATEGQFSGQTAPNPDQGQGTRRERRLERQGAIAPDASTPPNPVGQSDGVGKQRGTGRQQQQQPQQPQQPPLQQPPPQPPVTTPPATGGVPEQAQGRGQGQGRHEGRGRNNNDQAEGSPTPTP